MAQPSTADGFIGAALNAGATSLKAAKKTLWGYGGVVCSPDGTIWKVATSSKKATGPATKEIDDIVLLLGVADVIASERFYVDRGLAVFWPQVRRVRRPGHASQTGALRAPCPGKGRGRLPAGYRIVIGSDACALHRPGRVRVGGNLRLRVDSRLLLLQSCKRSVSISANTSF